ncbi:MAG TPA: hypothetical protein VI341_07245 [Actinomycetota bacterium]
MMKRVTSLVLMLAVLVSMVTIPGAANAGGSELLTVSTAGSGTGSVSGDGEIDCGQDCEGNYNTGETATLMATPSATSTFVEWKGDCSGTNPTCQVTMDGDRSVRAVFAKSFRPDEWIKLCGLSTGCVIDPLPHKWRGNGVYNTSGRKQTVAVDMEDGEGVRFWITLQNDGREADTFTVQGCRGTPKFVVNAVLVGKHKRPDWRAKNITKRFKDGTAEFSFDPDAGPQLRWLTVNIVAPTTAEGVTYKCPITISSQGQPSAKDTVLAVMTTY